ncbi:MAG: hypothetical protein JNM50_11965 [Chromatiales bacterium]|nr:hypothetical protein [Chromatiales bacterium]
MSRKGPKVKHYGGAFAAVPLEVMKSESWRWLPPFARDVCFALAAQFRTYKDDRRSNNGAIELTEKAAAEFGISRRELWAGIGLLIRVGLLVRMVEAKKRSGRGIPAKYALTWHPVAANTALNIRDEATARRTWLTFEAAGPRPKSVNAAAALLSGQAPRAHRNAFSSGTACEPTQAPRASRKSKVRAPRADLVGPVSGTACVPPSENLGDHPPSVVAAAAAATGGGRVLPVISGSVEPVSQPSNPERPLSAVLSVAETVPNGAERPSLLATSPADRAREMFRMAPEMPAAKVAAMYRITEAQALAIQAEARRGSPSRSSGAVLNC